VNLTASFGARLKAVHKCYLRQDLYIKFKAESKHLIEDWIFMMGLGWDLIILFMAWVEFWIKDKLILD
jgi:hypothetical protein